MSKYAIVHQEKIVEVFDSLVQDVTFEEVKITVGEDGKEVKTVTQVTEPRAKFHSDFVDSLIEVPDNVEVHWSFEDGVWVEETTFEKEQVTVYLKQFLKTIRDKTVFGGTKLDKLEIPTDQRTQSQMIAARIIAKEDASYAVNWKLPDGFTVLDSETIILIADSIRLHVQTTFDKEMSFLEKIDSGELTTVESVELAWDE